MGAVKTTDGGQRDIRLFGWRGRSRSNNAYPCVVAMVLYSDRRASLSRVLIRCSINPTGIRRPHQLLVGLDADVAFLTIGLDCVTAHCLPFFFFRMTSNQDEPFQDERSSIIIHERHINAIEAKK